jgi:hypothetical protein
MSAPCKWEPTGSWCSNKALGGASQDGDGRGEDEAHINPPSSHRRLLHVFPAETIRLLKPGRRGVLKMDTLPPVASVLLVNRGTHTPLDF